MSIIDTTNCHRAYITKDVAMNAVHKSHIADFRDMPMGSVQVVWTGAAGTSIDGSVQFYGSNLPEEWTFDDNPLECAEILVAATQGAKLWIRERIGFRYLQARYTPGNIVAGSLSIIALGKKS